MGKLGRRIKNYWTKPVLLSAGILLLIYLASILLKYFVLRGTQEPTFLGDELVYKFNSYQMLHGLGEINMHYPPLYSALLMPSFWFSNFYTVMKLINVAASSAIVFPVYWLAHRYLDRSKSYLLCVLCLLLPGQWVYPQYISSENLLLPLIVFSLYVVTKPLPAQKWQAWLWFAGYGLLAALLFYTRYQAIGVMLSIGIYLVLKLFLFERQRAKELFRLVPRLALLLVYSVVAAGVVVGFVALYPFPGVFQSFLDEMLGFAGRAPGAVGGGAPFAQWAVWYIAYMLLGIAPVVLPLVMHLKEYLADLLKAKYNGLLILSFLTCGALGVIAVRHSDKAYYNQDTSLYMLGRYITYAVLILLINAFIILFRNIDKAPKATTVRGGLIVTVVLLLFSFYSLYGHIGSPIRRFPFVTDSIVTADLSHFTLENPAMLYFALVVVLAMGMVFLFAGKKASLALTSLLLVFGLVSAFPVFSRRVVPSGGIGFTQPVFAQIDNSGGDVTVVNATPYGNTRIDNVVNFWRVSGGEIYVEALPQLGDDPALFAGDYLLSTIPLYAETEGGPLFVYSLPLDSLRLSEEGLAHLQQMRSEEQPEQAAQTAD